MGPGALRGQKRASDLPGLELQEPLLLGLLCTLQDPYELLPAEPSL